jgi:hypothetical protein
MIAVALGLAGDQHAHGLGAAIECLVTLAWRDFNAFAGFEDEVVLLDFESEFSFEDEEELAGVDMGVAGLAGTRWHELFDDAEFGSHNQVPAVAVCPVCASPLVVFG